MSIAQGGGLPQHSDVLNATPGSPEETKSLIAELKSRGNAAYKAQSFKEAEMLYEKALEFDPKEASIWGNRCAARLGMKEFQKALADADEAVKLGWTKGHFRRGQALTGLNRLNDALKAFEQCVKLDPENKDAKKEVEKLSKKLAEEAEEVPMDVEDVTEATKNKNAGAKTTATNSDKKKKKPSSDTKNENKGNEEDENESDLMRGYKTLADGRKTTFFHREISAEEKAKLAAENKPVALAEPVSSTASSNSGSAWNKAGTFEEKDMTAFATGRIKELVKGTTTVLDLVNNESCVVEALSVSDFDGMASVSFIRGNKKYPFDFTFNVEWQSTFPANEVFKGKLFYSYFSSDSKDFESEVKWENREKAGVANAKKLMDHLNGEFRKQVDARLEKFIQEFLKL